MSTFLRNVLKLVSGSVIAQLIGLLITPITTRLYTPEDFGILQLFLSISTILVAFAAFSYDRAILLPKEDDESANILVLCIILTTVMSTITGAILIIFSGEIGAVLKVPQISNYIIFIPLAVFVTSLFSVGNYWLSRRKRFGGVATAQVVNTVITRTVQTGAGVYSANPFGLIFGWLVGSCAALIPFLPQMKEDISLFRTVTIEGIKNIAIKYKKFPIFSTWSSVANILSTQVAPILLVYFFNPTVVGYFSVASMVVLLPVSIIGAATARVFFQRACEEKNRSGSIKNIVREVQQRLISIAIFPMFILLIIGNELFSVVLGSQWSTAGEYAGILAPWVLFVFIASPLGSIFYVLEKQAVDLSFNVLILISRVIVLLLGGLSGDPIVALILYSSTGVLFWGGMNLYLLKISGISYRFGLREYIRYSAISFVISIPLIVVKLLSLPTSIILIVTGFVSIVYYAIIAQSDPVLKKEFTGMLRGLSDGYRNRSGK